MCISIVLGVFERHDFSMHASCWWPSSMMVRFPNSFAISKNVKHFPGLTLTGQVTAGRANYIHIYIYRLSMYMHMYIHTYTLYMHVYLATYISIHILTFFSGNQRFLPWQVRWPVIFFSPSSSPPFSLPSSTKSSRSRSFEVKVRVCWHVVQYLGRWIWGQPPSP